MFIVISSVVKLNAQNYIPDVKWLGPIPAVEQEEPDPWVEVIDEVLNNRFKKISNSDLPDVEQEYGGHDLSYDSFCPVFNENSTMFLLNFGKNYKVENHEYVGRIRYLAGGKSFSNPMWSKVDPDILYGTIGLQFVAMDVINGNVLLKANGYYDEGELVTITAIPDWGYEFLGWEGDFVSTENPFTISIKSNINMVAVFSVDDLTGIFSNESNIGILPANPNPFTNSLTLEYNIEKNSKVKLSVFDISGREVILLVNKKQSQGKHEITWNGNDIDNCILPNGIYISKLRIGDKIISDELIIRK